MGQYVATASSCWVLMCQVNFILGMLFPQAQARFADLNVARLEAFQRASYAGAALCTYTVPCFSAFQPLHCCTYIQACAPCVNGSQSLGGDLLKGYYVWLDIHEPPVDAQPMCELRRAAGVAAAQWLSLRLQLLAACVVFLVAALGVAGASGLLPTIVTQSQG